MKSFPRHRLNIATLNIKLENSGHDELYPLSVKGWRCRLIELVGKNLKA